MNEVCKTTANITINQTKSTPRSTITGAKKGKIIKVISIQSKKNPNKNATNKTTITTPFVPKGKALRAPSINSSPPKPLKINANIVAPTKRAKI